MQFQLIYDGEALSNHEINPKELSVALLAINDLLENANKVVNNEKVKIKVSVKGSFQTGSFVINFSISLFDHIKDMFSSLPNMAAALLTTEQILELLFRRDCSLIALLRFLRGARPEKIYENEDGTFTIWKDKKKLNVEKKVYDLYRSYKLRKNFEELVSPVLDNDGISDVAIKHGDNFNKITKEEAGFFKCPEPTEDKLDDDAHFVTNISIINLSFKEGNKWFVNDGQSSFYIKVEDKMFLNKIEKNHIAFTKGDILKVAIRREQFYNKDESRLKTENFIEEVLSHNKPPEQMMINL